MRNLDMSVGLGNNEFWVCFFFLVSLPLSTLFVSDLEILNSARLCSTMGWVDTGSY